MRKTKEDWKSELRNAQFIRTDGNNTKWARTIRDVIAELASHEEIVFIPVKSGSHLYIRIEDATEKQIEDFYWTQIKHTKSHYKNKLKPIFNFVTEEHKKKIMGQLIETFEIL